jgi:hypothetical protein
MLGNRKLILDTWCEIYDLLAPWADDKFWNFDTVDLPPGSICVIGRQHLMDYQDRVREIAELGQCVMVFGNTAEG